MLSKHSLKSATTIGLLACFMSGMVVTSALALLSVQASSRDSKQTTSPQGQSLSICQQGLAG